MNVVDLEVAKFLGKVSLASIYKRYVHDVVGEVSPEAFGAGDESGDTRCSASVAFPKLCSTRRRRTSRT
jgi:hypothetical protein